jgi:hypothetical protein
MSDRFVLDLVNHPSLHRDYAGYAGFDGMILHSQRRRETGLFLEASLRGPGTLESDVTYTGLRRIMVIEDGGEPLPGYSTPYYAFAGYDVGKFDIESGQYSLILNYALDGLRTPPALNRFLLFDSPSEAEALLAAWEADTVSGKETFLWDEVLKPFAIYREVSV